MTTERSVGAGSGTAMPTPAILGAFAAALAVVFALAMAVGAAVGPVRAAQPVDHRTVQGPPTPAPDDGHRSTHAP